MIELFSLSQSTTDHGPFMAFALRRMLRVLIAAVLIVLLAGVVIANDAGYIEMLEKQEDEAQVKACEQALAQARAQLSPTYGFVPNRAYVPNEAVLQACPWYGLRH